VELDIEKLKKDKELLQELQAKKQEALKSGDIARLYELLDTFLLLELDEDIDTIFQKILEVAFDDLVERLSEGRGFDLRNEFDLNVARAIYEHALERWDSKDFKGAKELFGVLSYMIEDEAITKGLMVAFGLAAKKEPLERYIEEFVDRNKVDEESYFFNVFDEKADNFLNKNANLIEKELAALRMKE